MDLQAVETHEQDGPPSVLMPRLLDICWQAAASSDHWRYQRKYLDVLPEEVANLLLSELLRRHRLSRAPGYLSLFKRCVTSLVLGGREQHVRLDATWLAYVAELCQLRQLELHGDTNKPVLNQALVPLAALHGTLQKLSLLGDGQHSIGFKLGGAGLAVINQLTALRSLDISGTTSKGGPVLMHLTGLSLLTHLGCEELMITDDDCIAALPLFQGLASLNLAGCISVSDASFAAFEQLPNLHQLDIGWSGCNSLPCFAQLRVLSMRNSRLLSSEWCSTWLAERGWSVQLCLEEIQLRGCEIDSLEVLEALASLIRCSGSCLRTLDLSSITLQGSAEDDLLTLLLTLGATQHLTRLGLGHLGPNLRNEHLAAIAITGCTALADLDVSYSHTNGEGLEQLAQLPALSSLNVAGCSLHNADLPALWQLTSLTRLALQHNFITGEAPAEAALRNTAQLVDNSTPGSAGPAASAVQEQMHWGCLRQLRHLQLDPGRVRQAGVAALTPVASSLHTLLMTIDNGEVSGAITTAKELACIGKLANLRALALEFAPAALPNAMLLGGLQYLSTLDIHWRGPPVTAAAAARLSELRSQLPWLQTMTLQGKPADQAVVAALSPASTSGASSVGEQGPWQESSLRRQSGAGSGSSSNRTGTTPVRGASAPVANQQLQWIQREQTRSSTGRTRSPSPAAATVLSAFDQRIKYTPQQLLQLRGEASADGNAAGMPPPSQELRNLLPDDLRAEE